MDKTIKGIGGLIIVGILTGVGQVLYLKGKSDAIREMENKDYAEEIDQDDLDMD